MDKDSIANAISFFGLPLDQFITITPEQESKYVLDYVNDYEIPEKLRDQIIENSVRKLILPIEMLDPTYYKNEDIFVDTYNKYPNIPFLEVAYKENPEVAKDFISFVLEQYPDDALVDAIVNLQQKLGVDISSF